MQSAGELIRQERHPPRQVTRRLPQPQIEAHPGAQRRQQLFVQELEFRERHG